MTDETEHPWWFGGGPKDFSVSPSPLLGFLGVGTFGVWGLGLDNLVLQN